MNTVQSEEKTTACHVHLEESLFSLTVKFSADHLKMARIITKISHLLQKENVSNASISGSADRQ
jgi:hypothetical protein